MSMYEIYELSDGTYQCVGRIQDGTERWTEHSLADALKSIKTFAKVMNGTRLKKRDILCMRQQQVIETKWITFKP